MIRPQTSKSRFQNDSRRLHHDERYNLSLPGRGGSVDSSMGLHQDYPPHIKSKLPHHGTHDESESLVTAIDTKPLSHSPEGRRPRYRVSVVAPMHASGKPKTDCGVPSDTLASIPEGFLTGMNQLFDSSGEAWGTIYHRVQQQINQLVVDAQKETAKIELPTRGDLERTLGMDLDLWETALQEGAGEVLDSMATHISMLDRPRQVLHSTMYPDQVVFHGNGRIETMRHFDIPALYSSSILRDEDCSSDEVQTTGQTMFVQDKENLYGPTSYTMEAPYPLRIPLRTQSVMNSSGIYQDAAEGSCADFKNATLRQSVTRKEKKYFQGEDGLGSDTGNDKPGVPFRLSSVLKHRARIQPATPANANRPLPLILQEGGDHITKTFPVVALRHVNSILEGQLPDDETMFANGTDFPNQVRFPSSDAVQTKNAMLPKTHNEAVGQPIFAFEGANFFKQHDGVQPSGVDEIGPNSSIIHDDGSASLKEPRSMLWFLTTACLDSSYGNTSTSTEVAGNLSFMEREYPTEFASNMIDDAPPAVSAKEVEGTLESPPSLSGPLSKDEGKHFFSFSGRKFEDEVDEGRRCGLKMTSVPSNWLKSRRILSRGEYYELEGRFYRKAEI